MARSDAASRLRLAVVADDLTGAADAAGPFAGRGLDVSVALADPFPHDADVVAVVTDSRWRDAGEAAERVEAAVVRLRARHPELLFVKIDSTLRGRVREDVAAALAAWGASDAVATPAFPGQGRVVRNGTLLVRGEPLVPRIADRFPPGVHVVDAAGSEDLLAVAASIVQSSAVAVGSGGLSRALAEVLVPHPRLAPHRPAPVRGVLLVVGTTHAVTQAQAAALVDAGAVHVVLGSADPCAVATAAGALREGRRVLLTCRADDAIEPDSARAVALAEHIARAVRGIVVTAPSAGLVLTGGATALAVATALGARQLRLHSEVAEGLPLGELVTGDQRIPVVTKSGGFGDEGFLIRAAEALEATA